MLKSLFAHPRLISWLHSCPITFESCNCNLVQPPFYTFHVPGTFPQPNVVGVFLPFSWRDVQDVQEAPRSFYNPPWEENKTDNTAWLRKKMHPSTLWDSFCLFIQLSLPPCIQEVSISNISIKYQFQLSSINIFFLHSFFCFSAILSFLSCTMCNVRFFIRVTNLVLSV